MRLKNDPRGFTLVEVLVSSFIGVLILAAVISSYVFMGRNLARLANNQTVEAKSRLAMTYLAGDIKQATGVTSPTATSVTLAVPGGSVTYTYDATNKWLRRQATVGAIADRYLLYTDAMAPNQIRINCPAFNFNYYTTTNGDPTYQSSSTLVPYSIKMIEISFTVQSTGKTTAATVGLQDTLNQMQSVSARYILRNRALPTGS